MAPTTRKQREAALHNGQLSSLICLATPPRRRRPIPVSPITPQPMWVVYGNDRENALMGAPYPEDNSDIPSFDLGEPLDELSLWDRVDNAWKEHCKRKKKARWARMKRMGGASKAQRKWARTQKKKEKKEIVEWWERKMRERDADVARDRGEEEGEEEE